MEQENQDNKSPPVPWTEMREIPLERIYSFLGREEQLNMSHVCSKWKKAYKSSSLWQTFTFKYKDWKFLKTICLLTKLADTFGSMFRHIKIEYNGSYHSDCTHFENFFQTLMNSNPKLESVEFSELKDLSWSEPNEKYRRVCRVIADFLESQNELKQVKFFNCDFKLPDGVELLRQVVRKYRESLRCLGLRRFVSYDTEGRGPISDFTRNLPTLCDFPNLKTLDIDYSLILSKMFSPECFDTLRNRETPTPALSKMILLYDDAPRTGVQRSERYDELRVLNSARWQYLKTRLPNLKVELTIQTHLLTSEILEYLITPNTPITRLVYLHGGVNNAIKVTDRLRLCQINDLLVALHLGMYLPDADLVSPLNQILPMFPKLKCLELTIPLSTDIGNLIEHWRGNPLENLEKVVIHISDIRPDGWRSIAKEMGLLPINEDGEGGDLRYRTAQELRSRYVSLLDSVSMHVEVVIDCENRDCENSE